jgi:hypothetical protein
MKRHSTLRGNWRWGLGVLLAASGACYSENDYILTPEDADALLRIEPSSANLAADGFSTLELRATITGRPDDNRRCVVFATSAGTLTAPPSCANGSGGQTATRVETLADASGVALAQLKADPASTGAVVTVSIREVPEVTRTLAVAFVTPEADSVIRFTQTTPSADADGVTQSPFTVWVSPRIPGARAVRFNTTLGTFAQSDSRELEQSPNAGGDVVTILLKSPETPGTGVVSAFIQTVTRQERIQFGLALPDIITVGVTPPSVSVADGDTADVTITLTRVPGRGKVTPGLQVQLTSLAGTLAVGTFSPAQPIVDDGGKASATYSPGNTPFRGTVSISARVTNAAAEGHASIEVTN